MRKRKVPIDMTFQLSLMNELFGNETSQEIEEVFVIPEIEIIEPPKRFVYEHAIKENVLEQYPWLREHQAEDCATIEKRFYIDKEKGIQCTNGTGVGKTLLGLAVANRRFYNKKRNVLIVVPTDKKARDWVEDNNKRFDTELRQVESITSLPLMENGQPGMIVLTYSNYYQNEELEKYTWDLIIYDESHKLMENGQKKDTVYLQKHRKIANLPNYYKETVVKDNIELFLDMEVEKRDQLLKEFTSKTKVLFLSASPFAYHHNLRIGDGCLWNMEQNYSMNTANDLYNSYLSDYNDGSREDQFLMENLGYRMRYNKCTVPESGVDVPMMERNFFEKQLKLGSIIGRQINVDKDYSREFIIIDSEVGEKIDKGLSIISDKNFSKTYPNLKKVIDHHISWLYKNQLLEGIKAKLAPNRIRKHLDLGRKVVLFHDYNNSIPMHPFRYEHYLLKDYDLIKNSSKENDSFKELYFSNDELNLLEQEINLFNETYPELYNMEVAAHLSNPIEEIKKHFPDRAVFFNGTIGKTKRSKNKDAFQDDLSGIDIICVQRQAGKEGIDLHDKTGVYQRVMMDLGLPRRPTDSIQCEGRTYRDGLMSNSIWEYLTIQTIFERNTFANDISSRASTAENLAMGNKARNLAQAFKEGYSNADELEPSLEQGTGGKEKDRQENNMSEFEKSIALYYTNQKKTSKNKSKEGIDYFATPEPLGFKMVEWADIRHNEVALEPSCGHGAIARFFPGISKNYVVEKSRELLSKARLNIDNVDDDNFIEGDFMESSDMIKANSILMNPPFGHAGKDAILHLDRALNKHTRYYLNNPNKKGRVICIVPDTSNVDKYVNKLTSDEYWEEVPKEDDYIRSRKKLLHKNIKFSAEILLPSCTFNRAGTSVVCKVLIFDLVNNYNQYKPFKSINLRDIDKVENLFLELENIQIPTYVPYNEDEYFED